MPDSAPVFAQSLPAVSGPNGKIEFDAGTLSLPTPGFVGRAAGAFTVPLGERFGLQADLSASTAPGFTTSAALHLFTRDPASYLIGGTLGLVRSPGANVLAAGPEIELYRDRWTVEAWAGVALVEPTAPAPRRSGAFAMGTVAYYPTDNWRLSAGFSTLDGYTALELGTEYLFDNGELPLSVTGATRLGQDGALRVTVGLRTYFGTDPSKSLIRRHREDDPSDLGTALYTAASATTLANKPAGTNGAPAAGGQTSPGQQAAGQQQSDGQQQDQGQGAQQPDEHDPQTDQQQPTGQQDIDNQGDQAEQQQTDQEQQTDQQPTGQQDADDEGDQGPPTDQQPADQQDAGTQPAPQTSEPIPAPVWCQGIDLFWYDDDGHCERNGTPVTEAQVASG